MCCETKHVFFVCVQKLLLWLYLLLCNIISPQFHLPCPLESSFALNQGLLRSNLRLLLPSLHSCRDGGVEPPEGTKQEDDQHANHPDGHQQGTVPLFDLLLSNNDLIAGVEKVLRRESSRCRRRQRRWWARPSTRSTLHSSISSSRP